MLAVAALHALLLWPAARPSLSSVAAVPAVPAAPPVAWQLVSPAAPRADLPPSGSRPDATEPTLVSATGATRAATPSVVGSSAPLHPHPSPRVSPRVHAAPAAPPGVAGAAGPDPTEPAQAGAAGSPDHLLPAAAPPLPVYPTQLPAPARLHYRLQRDGATGSAQLDWELDDTGYRLRLQAEVDGRALGGAVSRGEVNADGLAPLRLADLKRGREVRAANFRRDQQRITFSGPSLVRALLPGTQDRLSWLIQLPAVVQANPALALAGARVTLRVVGTGGDAEAWHFDAQGVDPIELPDGSAAQALRFVREPVRPYDLLVEVWLDPARGHLPVATRLATRPQTRTTEWRLAAIDRP